MYLSDRDRRVLAELERQLAAGAAPTDRRTKAPAAVRRQLGVLTGAMGSVLLLVSLFLGVLSGVLLGALLLASWMVAPLRRHTWEAEDRTDDG